jgi:hypothetical protein
MKDSAIIEALERLGAQFPWDITAIWLERKPAGDVSITTYIPTDYERRTDSAFGHGETLDAACQDLIKNAGVRDPEAQREAKIREYKELISKLEAANFGPPPYRPGTRLAPGALSRDVEVEAQPQGAA